MQLKSISREEAKAVLEKYSGYRGDFTTAISVKEGDSILGVIALNHDGAKFSLGHIWSDGSAHVGSLLYGAAWRTAKAMGYDKVWI